MENLKDRTTAELLAEWEELSCKRGIYHVDKCNTCGHEQRSTNYWSRCDRCDSVELTLLQLSDESKARKEAIAAELNRRCSELGVGSKDGRPIFRFYTTDKPTEGLVTEIVAIYVDSPPYTLEELRDLLTWLLLKGGNG